MDLLNDPLLRDLRALRGSNCGFLCVLCGLCGQKKSVFICVLPEATRVPKNRLRSSAPARHREPLRRGGRVGLWLIVFCCPLLPASWHLRVCG